MLPGLHINAGTLTPAEFTPETAAFRFYDDDAGEATSTQLAAQDTNITVSIAGGDAQVQLRLRVDETGGLGGLSTDDWQLQVSKNAAAYANVAAASSNVRAKQPVAPPVDATNTSSEGDDVTSHTVALPAGIVSGQMLIALFGHDGGTDTTVTWPGDWTQFFIQHRAATAITLAGAYRIADGSEGASITVTTSDAQTSTHNTYAIGRHSGNAPEATTSAASSSSPDSPSLTPSWGNKLNLWLTAAVWQNSGFTSYPANYTNGLHVESAGTGFKSQLASARRALAAASEDPGAFTLTGSDPWAAATIAIEPEETLVDGAATTNRATNGISDPGAGSFVAGVQEASDGLIADYQLTASNFTEHVWALTLVAADLLDTDTLDFRLLLNGSPITANVTPRITISTV